MRQRVRLNQYGSSKSAREVAKYLGILRLKKRTKFKPRPKDIIVNWGMPKNGVQAEIEVNPQYAIAIASNKLYTLSKLQEKAITVPEFSQSLLDWTEDTKLVARTTLYGHSGKGIVIGTQRELYNNEVSAPLYTKYIDKVKEYRVIVCGGKVIDIKMKRRRKTPEGEESLVYNEDIWNLKGNYVYTREIGEYNIGLHSIGINAVKALELDFGAVDVIEDEEGTLFVLEVNTAFGIEGSTLEKFGKALKEVIDDYKRN